MPPRQIGFLLLGGIHHILHLIPPAAELEKQANFDVSVFVLTKKELKTCQSVLAKLGAPNVTIHVLSSPNFFKRISPKLSSLIFNLNIWRSLDVLIVAERTSTILRYCPVKLRNFIHIPHGAGDGPLGYDRRIKLFDHVIVAGQKDKRRMIELGLSTETSCSVSGYIKPYTIKTVRPDTPKIFENNRPIVLYNPHAKNHLSSWPKFGRQLLQKFERNKDFNFIFAPHIRLFSDTHLTERQSLEKFSIHDHIHVDLGSERSTDMTYTRAADIYLGDVSSQVYEFLSHPKPCIFLNAHNVDWKNDPHYRHWFLGTVISDIDNVMLSLGKAQATHVTFVDLQSKQTIEAIGQPDWNPIKRASDVITRILDQI